jgi:hypothetical protein
VKSPGSSVQGEDGGEEHTGVLRSFASEFKAETFQSCQHRARTTGQGSRDFALTETVVRSWVQKGGVGIRQRQGLSSKQRRENHRLEWDVGILNRTYD